MITNYKKAKEDVLKAYSSFLPIIETVKDGKETSYDASLSSLAKQAENIRQDKFLLMIVGEAKSGKSTFINAYLGEEILPMDVKQCTSSIVEIRYGEKFILRATYADDRVLIFEDEQQIKDFLTANAALDDNYRDIPVSTINIEILMHKKDKRVLESEIVDLLKGIKAENIYGLPEDEYEDKVRRYIKEKQPVWKDIVKKIEIEYPFADADLKGIEIVDTPGVNADGRVGDITNKYIEEANAVMFLKPLTGQALEATSFRKFLKSKSADRNKNAMFWILTRRADLTEEDITRLQEEAIRQCPTINPKQIILIDSKVELFYNIAHTLTAEELQAYIMEMGKAKKLDAFIKAAWFDATGDRDEFLRILKELSNFAVMDEALNLFAHKAQYIMLSEFLGRMLSVMEKVMDGLEETIEFYKEKAEDPIELANKMNHIKRELEEMTHKINQTVDEVALKYSETNGLIDQKADKVIAEYKAEIEKIDPEGSASLDELEKISFRKIDIFTKFEAELQKNIVDECDKALIALSDKSAIKYSTLKPDLTKESFEKIKDEMRNSSKARESYFYTTGTTFKRIETGSRFSQKKYYGLVRDSIKGRIDGIKNQAVKDLRTFVKNTTTAYSSELTRNAQIKRDEWNAIVQAKQTADEIQNTIKGLEGLLAQLQPMREQINGLKGGIDNHV